MIAIGVDVHKRQCTVAIQREDGELGCFGPMENTREGWRELLDRLPPEAEIALEVSTSGYFAMSVLEEAGWLDRTHWVHTAGIDSLRKQKYDRLDAQRLARKLSVADRDPLPEAWFPPAVSEQKREELAGKFGHLSNSQRQVVEEILSSRDQVVALEGVAGAGKTTSLAAIREAAERQGYKVEGFAPTSRAAQQLGDAGIHSSTLQHHLARSHTDGSGERHLYVVDESSLATTRQVNEFLHRLQEQDRVIFVGDTRQHQGVEAGRPFQQLQEAGMHTAHLDEIIRQKDAALKHAVEQLAHGQVQEAIENLRQQGRVHEIVDRHERLEAKLRPGNVHSAENWEEVLLPEIERQQKLGKEVIFRADAAFAKPEV